MEPIASLEEKMLQEIVDSGRTVRIITVNGYQSPVKIVDFDCEVIVAKKEDETWMVYRHAVSTIVMD